MTCPLGSQRPAVERGVEGNEQSVIDERRDRLPDLFPIGGCLELLRVEALILRRTWQPVVGRADEEVIDALTPAVSACYFDNLDGRPRADRSGVNDEPPVVQLVWFGRRPIGLSGLVEHVGPYS